MEKQILTDRIPRNGGTWILDDKVSAVLVLNSFIYILVTQWLNNI